jgi:hypothetical protein
LDDVGHDLLLIELLQLVLLQEVLLPLLLLSGSGLLLR